jgi:hypothetical protein
MAPKTEFFLRPQEKPGMKLTHAGAQRNTPVVTEIPEGAPFP